MVQNLKIAHTKVLLQDALRVLLKRKTLEEISVTELCGQAGVTRSTFYRHYNIPRDVIQELWEQVDGGLAMQLQQLQELQAVETFGNRVTETWCQRIYEDREKWQLILASRFDTPVKISPPDETFYAECMEKGCSREDADALFAFIFDGMVGAVGKWIMSPEPAPPDVFSKRIEKILGMLHI